jgi:osmotically-inducible protein OsmY
MNARKGAIAALLVLSTITTQGCFWIATGAAVTAVTVATDRRTVGRVIDDNLIELEIKDKIYQDDALRKAVHIDPTSVNGIVLLTGEASSDTARNDVLRIARDVTEVRQVINEINISGKADIGTRANDTWLLTKVKTKITRESGIAEASRVNVHVAYSVVYLMGVVSRAEGDAAANAARTVGGVSRVVKIFEYID